MILATITLTFSNNTMLQLINFICFIILITFQLLAFNVEITLLIVIIYSGQMVPVQRLDVC